MRRMYRGQRPQMMEGAWIADDADVIGNVALGRNASVWFQSVIRADCDRIIIGEESNVQDRCVLHTDPSHVLRIGTRVTIGHGCILHGCTIEDECLIGMGATILNGAIIHSHCIIGAGALVLEGMELPEGSLAVGAPARIIKQISEQQLRQIIENAEHYVKLASEYQREEGIK